MSGSGMDVNSVFNKFQAAVDNVDVSSLTKDYGEDGPSTQDLMNMQKAMQDWSLATSTQSNVLKALGEGMKSTIGNIR